MPVILLEVARVALTLALLGMVLACSVVVMRTWVSKQKPIDSLSDRVNALLPQIQCAKCGYPGCRPYAEAVVNGERTDLCPPGGDATAIAVAELMGRPTVAPAEPMMFEDVALIDEHECVGCALCIKACPVDAIVGAERFTHTVVDEHCTGCELCIPVCPVDCIDMVSRLAHA